MDSLYGSPNDVIFCSECVMSNQRPSSIPEFKHTKERVGAKYLHIDEHGVCDACRQAKVKETINWDEREDELQALLARYRKSDGSFDCLVPGSGGKDSAYQSHILKYKYGMNPLTVTWPPILYTSYGYENFLNWLDIGGFDNITYRPNGNVMRQLTRLSIENLLHPFQTFILGQKNLAPKVAAKYGIDLVFYGENEAEYGNPIADNSSSLRERSYYAHEGLDDLVLAGFSVRELIEEHDFKLGDLLTFLPMPESGLGASNIQIHYLGYYLKWIPQEAYYYASENTGFQARPFRTQGTFSKYNSIDDKIDDLHYYTTYIKYGLGRASYDASQEIRNKHCTRDEAILLVNKYDGEFPDKYFDEIMKYLGIEPDRFHELCDEFRSPHLWSKQNNTWKLRHNVMGKGCDD